jgi:Domain of unknown function (DUF5103)
MTMQKIFFGLIACLVFNHNARGQAENPNNENRIFDEEIRTVQLNLRDAPLTLPILEVRVPNGTLNLEFDHLGTETKDYGYSLTHCNSNWQPSELEYIEYLDGFNEDRILDFYNSFNTLQQYTHYRLRLPNANMRWTKSGNYLLKIFDNDADKQLVLVRRFCVVEPGWRIETQFVRPAMVDKLNTHHEFDFNVVITGTRVPDPQNDIKTFVLQNGRWDNAIGPLKPQFARGDLLVYDFQDKVVFPAGKEWRFFDLRTFESKRRGVHTIREKDDYYEVFLLPDKSRAGRSYEFYGDLNGRFSTENINPNQTLLQCDYAEVLFSIQRELPEEDADVYVFGELSDWQLKPEFKMEFDAGAKLYLCKPFLKQGVYNYQYLVVDRESGKADIEGFEGNWYETSNQYTVLTYFRPFGERYDRLMVAATTNSASRQ